MRPLVDVASDCGISERQARLWGFRGWVKVTFVSKDEEEAVLEEGGPGTRAMLTEPEQRRLEWMARLVDAGLEPEAAAVPAQQFAAGAATATIGHLRLAWVE